MEGHEGLLRRVRFSRRLVWQMEVEVKEEDGQECLFGSNATILASDEVYQGRWRREEEDSILTCRVSRM